MNPELADAEERTSIKHQNKVSIRKATTLQVTHKTALIAVQQINFTRRKV
jgi:hypothetical protein